MSFRRPSVLASGLLARPGGAPARSTEIEDLPRSIEQPALPSPPPAVVEAPSTPAMKAPAEPAAPRQEIEEAPSGAGKGIKGATMGTTLYLLPDEAYRLKRLALDLRVSLHDLMLDGLDLILSKHGADPLTRYTPQKPKKR